jgi:acetyl esterase
MPLDPQVKALIASMAAMNLPPIETTTPAEAREMMRKRSAALGPGPEVASVVDHSVPVTDGQITVRVYSPAPATPLPALVFYHGGGWVIGDLYTHDGICRTLANAAGVVVASVDYRLAPEFKYPVAAEDSYAALTWVAAHAKELGVDPRRIAVGGDSAGGNLAVAVALMARDRGGPDIAFQALIYPVTDHGFDTPSYLDNADGYMLTRAGMRWFWDHYLPCEADGGQPYASPLRADLRGLPPAIVVTAEYDPLRDEGEALASKLSQAGVAVTLTRYPGQVHGFFRLTPILDGARVAVDEVASALRKTLV